MSIRVIVAEDDLLVREGLQALLRRRPEFEVLAACADADALREAVARDRPDVVVTDVRMPPTHSDDGIRFAVELRASQPRTGVVVLSQYPDPGYAMTLLADGSAGRAFLLKERIGDVEVLASAMLSVASGGSVLDTALIDSLVARAATPAESPLVGLTNREREVLSEMAQGRSNAAIAQALVLSERAVEKYVGTIFLKLGLKWEQEVSRRVMAVLMFLAATDR